MTLLSTVPKATSGPFTAISHTPLPPWVRGWTGSETVRRTIQGLPLSIWGDSGASLVSIIVPGAIDLSSDQFEQRTCEAYKVLRTVLAEMSHSAPVRFWNYLPAIHQMMEDRRDRYMAFNAGRFDALTDWFGGPQNLVGQVPTASGVGHGGSDLAISCLALAEAGQSIENPRQISAWQYSERYGLLPPCFARATVVTSPRDGSRSLLVGGTASIRGEESVHPGDVHRQLDETLLNLQSLLSAAQAMDDLAAFTEVRAYYARGEDQTAIEAAVRAAFGAATNVEMMQAELCRAELLVEIEGVAALQARGGT